MATITIDIPDSLHAQMSQVDLNWSEICRQAITAQLATKPQNTAKPEPMWRDACMNLSPETVFKPASHVEDGIIHPAQLTKKFDEILSKSKFTLGSREQESYLYIDKPLAGKILEPYAEWRPCIYKLQTVCKFSYLDDNDFYTGLWIWRTGDSFSRGTSKYEIKIWFGTGKQLMPIHTNTLQEEQPTQFINLSLLKSEFEFEIELPSSDEKIICKGPYDFVKPGEISGSYSNASSRWYAIRL